MGIHQFERRDLAGTESLRHALQALAVTHGFNVPVGRLAGVKTLTFAEARHAVLRAAAGLPRPPRERLRLREASGRILASPLLADRDAPPAPVSLRDGFAVRAGESGPLRVVGEVRAGAPPACAVGPGEAVEIMTGALLPPGAEAVVMVEHARRDGEFVDLPPAAPGQFVNTAGTLARAGAVILEAGSPLDYAALALAASVGASEVEVYRRPRIAILATGDELVPVESSPAPHQVRNSNAYSLAAQVARAGGQAVLLPVAPDDLEETRRLVHQGLHCDLLLVSGGVSAGKYDYVETALDSAEIFFDRVLIQPGQPCVFGRAAETFFFGLPGNPVSTMVCFEIFARPLVEALAGRACPAPRLAWAPLKQAVRPKPGLTRFLPASLDDAGVELLPWQGSADIAPVARAAVWAVLEGPREPGDFIQVLCR